MNHYDASILRVSQYIEKNIEREITLEECAHIAAFSKFHFTRIFKSAINEQLSDFIRKRRLTLAAKALLETNTAILEIALTYGYASQEAFTRAFKSYMGISPQVYRKKDIHYTNLYRDALSEALLVAKQDPVTDQFSLTELPSINIVGLPIYGKLSNQEISKHWNVFYAELIKHAILPEAVTCFGYEALDNTNQPFYLAAVDEVHIKELPQGWLKVHIPQHRFAVFTLANVVEGIDIAVQNIYRDHLPRLGLKAALNFCFEYYDADYKSNDLSIPIQLYIPIEG